MSGIAIAIVGESIGSAALSSLSPLIWGNRYETIKRIIVRNALRVVSEGGEGREGRDRNKNQIIFP